MSVPKIGRIQEVDLRSVWPKEAQSFTPWLEENPDELGDLLGLDLELSKEHPIGSFSLDLVGTDLNTGRRVIIENQLEKSNHSHLGQLLTYAGGVRPHIIVWVAKAIREEHRAALAWLNSVTDNETHFFGVEVKAIKIGDSLPGPMLEVVVEPNVWGKSVREAAVKATTSDRFQAYSDFWATLKAEMSAEFPELEGRTAWARSYFPTSTGFADLALNFVFSSQGLRVEFYFGSRNPELSDRRFSALASISTTLQDSVDQALSFEALEGKKASRIAVYGLENSDIENREEWEDYLTWFRSAYRSMRSLANSKAFKSALSKLGD